MTDPAQMDLGGFSGAVSPLPRALFWNIKKPQLGVEAHVTLPMTPMLLSYSPSSRQG